MVEYILFSVFAASFIATLLFTPYWIKRAKSVNLVGKDMHKVYSEPIVEAGGISVIIGFIFGLLVYVAIHIFYFKDDFKSLYILAVMSSILIMTIIGLLDDLLGWKKGLKQWQKPLIVLIAALPIIVINAGRSIMWVPFLGPIDFGLFYTFLLIPIGIAGAANGFNMIGGYNGLETGLGLIILATLGFISWEVGVAWVSVIALCMVFALLAFYIFNKYPARVFPGNVLSYSVGALIAIVAILGNIEKFALILFIPYFIEFVLKARGRFKKESFARVNSEGSLDIPYDKIYGIEHLAIKLLKKIKSKVYEKDVVYFLYGLEIILAGIVLLII